MWRSINEALARRLRDRFGVADPVGQAVDLPLLGFGRDRRAIMTIVGVIGNERVRSDLRAPAEEVAYVPIAQAPRMQVKLAVRTHGDAAAVVPAMREAVRQVDGRLALADVRTMEEIWAGSLSGVREPVWLLGDLRRRLGAAGRARPLRRAGAYRDPAAPRDRHPHGARCARQRRAVARRAQHAERWWAWDWSADWLAPLP